MTWFRVDDTFAMHPKAVAAGNAALGLWVRAGSWSAQQLTDGAITRPMLAAFGARTRDAQALVAAGLWLETGDGWQFKNWDVYQPTKAEVEEERARQHANKARAGKAGGIASGVARRKNRGSRDEAGCFDSASSTAKQSEAPTRPEPFTGTDVPAATVAALIPRQAEPEQPTAQTLLTEYVNACRERPPERVRGQLGQQIKALLAEGIRVEHIRAGLALFAANPKSPSVLPAMVNEAMNAGSRASPQRSTTDQRVSQALALATRYAEEDT